MNKILLMFSLCFFLCFRAQARVENPTAFIGEPIVGATTGAPLSADANDKLVSGITTNSVNATSGTTTTSATDVLIASMTLTPVAGTYYVSFHTSFTHSANNATITYTLYSGGSAITGTAMIAEPTIQGGLTPTLPFSQPGSISGFATVNGSQAIEARWKTSGATATAGARILNIVRVQ